jgi:hypothetical protein
LLFEFGRHRQQDFSSPFVEEPNGKTAAMLGMAPKLKWAGSHASQTH